MKKIASGLIVIIAVGSFARADQWIVGRMTNGVDGKVIFTKDATFSPDHSYQFIAGDSTCVAQVLFPGTEGETGSLGCGITIGGEGMVFSTDALRYYHEPAYLTVTTLEADNKTQKDIQKLYIRCIPEAKN